MGTRDYKKANKTKRPVWDLLFSLSVVHGADIANFSSFAQVFEISYVSISPQRNY